ncbi:hypothetical protein [Melghiribacillus thermohalophilus]|uniref:hypothetical protein n=1 Tax=Melghiribacillus thermohalophilus TaxID=1324956 RepID=UPI001404DFEB|nr:hypothetical protein [Melghiribacillus thermohalophilus]
MKPKVLKKGNTTIKIYSHLAHMTKEEQKKWFESEWEKGNPTLKNIVNAVKRCLDEEGK